MISRSLLFLMSFAVLSAPVFAQNPDTRQFQMFFELDGGGYLGVQTEEITKATAAKYGLREVRGVAVDKVVEGSPAQSAGLQAGDVILKLNGEAITSVRKLSRLVSEISPDHQARVTVWRDGGERDISVTVGKRPEPRFSDGRFDLMMPRRPDGPGAPGGPPTEFPPIPKMPPAADEQGDFLFWRGGSNRRIGVGVSPLTKQLAEHFGVRAGVLVTEVRENSPAAKAGLKAGDIITEAGGKALDGDMDLIRAVGETASGSLNLTIVRGGNRQTISVTPEEVKGEMNLFRHGEGFRSQPFRLTVPSAPRAPLEQMFLRGRIL